MVVTYLDFGNCGRTGNCLFQAAATIATALKNNDDYIFPDNWKDREHFNIPDDKFTKETIQYSKTYVEPFFHYATIPYQPNLNLSGYYQSELYFKEYEKEIKTLFEYKQCFPENTGVTSMHIRRGDYTKLGNSYYTDLANTSYYEEAMNIIKSDCYFVFSDDINWCKERFKGTQFIFIEGNKPHIDMALMSSCENNIIANSSYSWWAAYLNKNTNKKIIAPKNWFGPKLQHNTKNLTPITWNKI